LNKSVIHKVDGKERPLEIRWSTDDDAKNIYEWLKEEDRQGVLGNFLCNWHLTEQCHQERRLLVLFDKMNDIPIGYQWGQLLQSGILQIRYDWRGKDLGRLIVQHCIELAQNQDEAVLSIECKPPSSIPFWKSMGFTIVEGEYGNIAKGYLVLTKPLDRPAESAEAKVRVSSYPEERKWREDIAPINTFLPQAVRSANGTVYLAERAAFPSGVRNNWRDPVIEIVVDGRVIYRDKAKYEKAHHHGVRSCRNGFFIDQIVL